MALNLGPWGRRALVGVISSGAIVVAGAMPPERAMLVLLVLVTMLLAWVAVQVRWNQASIVRAHDSLDVLAALLAAKAQGQQETRVADEAPPSSHRGR